jgi:hypothetical protein
VVTEVEKREKQLQAPREAPDSAYAEFYDRNRCIDPARRRAGVFIATPNGSLMPIEEHYGSVGMIAIELCTVRGGPANLVTVVYGASPDGMGDDIYILERGGVVVAYTAEIEGRLYLGLVSIERRKASSATCLEVPRGFNEPGDTFAETAEDESAEEVGHFRDQRLRLIGTNAGYAPPPGNANTAWCGYLRQKDGSPGGIVFMECRVPPGMLLAAPDGTYVFQSGMLRPRTAEKAGLVARISGMVFVPINELSKRGVIDHFTRSAAFLLLEERMNLGNK